MAPTSWRRWNGSRHPEDAFADLEERHKQLENRATVSSVPYAAGSALAQAPYTN